MQFTTTKFTITTNESNITSRYIKHPGVGVLTATPEKTSFEMVNIPGMDQYPCFTADHLGDGVFNCDIDCGAQRWRGHKSWKEVRQALRNSGLTVAEINKIKREMKF